MSSYTELKNQVIAGKVSREDLISMVIVHYSPAKQSFIDSLESLTDAQLIDMLCIED